MQCNKTSFTNKTKSKKNRINGNNAINGFYIKIRTKIYLVHLFKCMYLYFLKNRPGSFQCITTPCNTQ